MKEKWIITKYFQQQVDVLKKEYRFIEKDIEKFFALEYFIGHDALGHGLWKCRLPNTSIPTGKRGGFRMIVAWREDVGYIPLLIYSKHHQADYTKKQLDKAIQEVTLEGLQ